MVRSQCGLCRTSDSIESILEESRWYITPAKSDCDGTNVGNIPTEICQLSSLEKLYFHNNKLSGNLIDANAILTDDDVSREYSNRDISVK